LNKVIKKQYLIANFWLLFLMPAVSFAAPGDTLFADDFDRDGLGPWISSDPAATGILSGGQTSGSNPRGAYTSAQAVTVASPVIGAAVPAAALSIWVRRGSNQISDGPEAGEDFLIEYQRADLTWGTLAFYPGSGTDGETFIDGFALPADALHNNLVVRIRQTGGSGAGQDFWHFDDVAVVETPMPGLLTVGTCDYFENGISNWTFNTVDGLAGISGATSSSPVSSLFLNGGIVEVVSRAVDTSDPLFTDLTMWIQRGRSTFSDDPDNGENLDVEYLNIGNTWQLLETFTGNGGPGQVYSRSYNLPADGRHTNFRLRFRMTGGSGLGEDFWHIDDICFAQTQIPVLQVSKVQQLLSDPVNGAASPYAIPGAYVEYTIAVTNQGPGPVDSNSLVITDPLPAGVGLFVDTDAGDPISFTDGATASGLSFNYASDVTFSSQPGGGAPYDHVPAPDTDGFDPAITGYRIAPSGTMNAANGGNDPSFSITLRVRIE
jgi:uncharacterized repeat protein (TIGR01451 family)